MCIAIVTTAGTAVDDATVRNCYAANPHGSGFAYIDKDSHEVQIRKGYFSVDAFLTAYKGVLDKGHADVGAMLLHFRVATMGGRTMDNCHPFRIKHGALIHNGVLFYGVDPTNKDRSDTRIWAEELTPDFTYERVRDNKDVLEQIINYNKIAMLFNGGNYAILNEDAGHWVDDVWYSNSTFRPILPYGRRRWTTAGVPDDNDEYPGHPYDWE